MNVLKGFATTFKHVYQEKITLQYPEEVRPFPGTLQRTASPASL